jgi:hypothetical protein
MTCGQPTERESFPFFLTTAGHLNNKAIFNIASHRELEELLRFIGKQKVAA